MPVRINIGFYHLPADQAALCAFLLSSGNVLARGHQSIPADQPLAFGPLEETLHPEGGVFLICRQADLGDVATTRFEQWGKTWQTVEPESAPVLTYSYESLDRHQLHRSSLGAVLECFDADSGQRRKKTQEFRAWARSVVAWMKSRCSLTCTLNGTAYPCTPAVAEALNAGKVVLRN